MNSNDMVERGWKNRTSVDITSHYNGELRLSKKWTLIAYDIPEGNIATYFPEANSLVPLDSTASLSNTPTSKFIEVSLQAHAPIVQGDEEE